MKALAIFDFDGTLTTKDSLIKFLLFYAGWPQVIGGALWLSPLLIAYKLKIVPNDVAKERLLGFFIGGKRLEQVDPVCRLFAREEITRFLRPEAMEKLNWHKKMGHEIVVVSASPENWLKPWAETMQINLIATRLEVIDQTVTGKFEGKNCYGPEKLRRLQEVYDLHQYEEIYTYGDTRGDKEILEVATHKFYRKF